MKDLIKKVLKEYSADEQNQTASDSKIYGSYSAEGQPNQYDALHSFQRRASDGFGGRMNTKVQNAIKDYKKRTGVRAVDIKSVLVKIDPKTLTVNWEVVIGPSRDGYTYDYFDSRGSAGGGESAVDKQLTSMHGYNPGTPKMVYHYNENIPVWFDRYGKKLSSPKGTINIQQKFFKYGKKA